MRQLGDQRSRLVPGMGVAATRRASWPITPLPLHKKPHSPKGPANPHPLQACSPSSFPIVFPSVC